jgi:alkylation response protein AidB-like acyl-CoA dehydrogenase
MFFFTEEHNMMRRMVRDFAESEIAPLAADIDHQARFPHETFRKMAGLGLLGIPYPEEWGGAGADYLSYAIAVEEVARVCGSTALSMAAHTTLGCGPLHHFGTDSQKKKYLRRLTSGEILGAYGLTEPNSGSDAG